MDPLVIDGSTRKPTWSQQEIDYFEDYLAAYAGLTYSQVTTGMAMLKNTPGCHWPLVALFTELFRRGMIKSALEFGSGATTAFLARLANKYFSLATTLENYPEWFQTIQQLLQNLGIYHGGFHLIPEFWVGSHQTERAPYDLVFADCAPRDARVRALTHYRQFYHSEAIILFDDCQDNPHHTPLNKVFQSVVDYAQENGFTRPGRFFSETRGIAVIDPAHKIDFLQFEIEPEYR